LIQFPLSEIGFSVSGNAVLYVCEVAAVPVPLRAIAVDAPVEELLVMVSWPEAAPAAVGLNCAVNDAVWPGFSVTGNVAPDTVKPVPVTVAALTVIGAVPVEVKVTDCVAGVLTTTLPNATLVALELRVDVTAFNFKAKLRETPPAVAVRVTVCVVATDTTVAVKAALVAFAGTVTVAGSVTAALLLARPTLSPPLGAAPFKVTVQASVPVAVMVELLQASAVGVAEAVPDCPSAALKPDEPNSASAAAIVPVNPDMENPIPGWPEV
jgi:hypothetical protein